MRRVRTRYKFPHWNVARAGMFPTVTASGGSPSAPVSEAHDAFGYSASHLGPPIYERQYSKANETPGHPSGSNAFFTDASGANEISVPYGLYYGNVVAI